VRFFCTDSFQPTRSPPLHARSIFLLLLFVFLSVSFSDREGNRWFVCYLLGPSFPFSLLIHRVTSILASLVSFSSPLPDRGDAQVQMYCSLSVLYFQRIDSCFAVEIQLAGRNVILGLASSSVLGRRRLSPIQPGPVVRVFMGGEFPIRLLIQQFHRFHFG